MKNKHHSHPFNTDRNVWKYGFVCIVPLFVILFFACSGKQVDGPGIKFEKETYDFGKVNEGETVAYTFQFKNNGTEILIIENVKPTCGCISITGEYDRQLQPGATGEIPVELDTGGIEGKMARIIRVSTNIPAKKEIILTLQGTVYTPISVNPDVLWLVHKNRTTVSLSGSFTITNNTNEPMEILPITPSDKNVTADIIIIRENKIFTIEITANPPFYQGNTEETLEIQTTLPGKEYITLKYAYNIHAAVIVYPQSIILEPVKAATKFEKTINVENHFIGPVTIANPRVTGGTLQYNIEEPVKDGKTTRIRLLFPAGFVLKETDNLVFSFTVKKDQVSLAYDIPIMVSE